MCLFGLHWVMPHYVVELFESLQGKFRQRHNIDLWRLVPHCVMWCIWRERSARSFEGCEQSLLEIKSFFLHTLLAWSVALSHFSCFSLPVLPDHCNSGSWFLPPTVHLQCTQVCYFFLIKKLIFSFFWYKLKLRIQQYAINLF